MLSLLKILTLLAFTLPTIGAQSEDKEPEPLYSSVSMRYISWKGGEPQLIHATISEANISNLKRILAEDEIRKELEIVEKQDAQLDNLLNWIDDEADKFVKYSKRGILPVKHVSELVASRTEAKKRISDILMPFQNARLDEIKNRLLIRNFGVIRYLKLQSKRSTPTNVDVSDEEFRSIEDQLAVLMSEIDQEATSILKDSVDELIGVLNTKQSQVVQFEIDGGLVLLNLDLFRSQLQYALETSFEYGASDDELFSNLVDFRPSFSVRFDGNFVAKKSGGDAIILPRFVKSLSDNGENPLNLSDEQTELLGRERGRYRAIVKEQQTIRGQGRVTETVQTRFNEALMAAAKDYNLEFEIILGENQLKLLKELFARSLKRRFGLPCELLGGDLGRRIKLTERQREKIRSVFDSQVREFSEKLLKWDEDVINVVKSNLTKENLQQFNADIGPRLKHVIPSYSVILESNLK